ncbi:uncharacterized protein zgc:193726 isoform X2 [Alosa sapidissima]|uniref:uncharacterized protein zgc:193726 isoform X2 n=1 Tax=Alosa sapidissima TaxID=34773 RepID=UPI001C08C627|nr:uncharacterized protein zgc:193726 isoform X2 [Alosa sapidissima]
MLSDTMSPAWSLSALLLGCVFGFPISFNSTQSDTRSKNQSYEMNTNGTNSTPPDIGPTFNDTFMDPPFIFNSTQSDTRSKNQSYEMNTNGTNSTPPDIGPTFNDTFMDPPFIEPLILLNSVYERGHGCLLPTCALSNLGNSLNTGDEEAGSSTSDPHGIGKK